MNGKKVVIGARPTAKPTADDWVERRDTGDAPEKMKRLTIDIPASLHRQVKAGCAAEDKAIADVVRELLMQKYGKP